uniref:Calcium load-activated calcium channel n=1 Tax=Kalanchoe fedtschenkoi TaxID=63787 RepID=A0A7N0ZVT9_KALFE
MASFSSSQYSDCPTVVGISICTTFIFESISWLLIYRTDSYKTLCFSIDRASKKLESMKTTASNPIKKSSKVKKMDRFETTLKESNRDLSLFKFKSGPVVALVLFVVFGLLNSLFEGRPVVEELKAKSKSETNVNSRSSSGLKKTATKLQRRGKLLEVSHLECWKMSICTHISHPATEAQEVVSIMF